MASETITSITQPWQPQQQYLKSGFRRAENLYGRGGPTHFPGQTFTPYGNVTNRALNMTRQQAQQGSPTIQPLQGMMGDTLSGNFLNSNRYLDQMMDSASRGMTRNYREAVAPSIGAQFDSAGRYGSGLYENSMDSSRDNLQRGLGEMAGNIYGQNYANERTNQMQAAALAPQTVPLNYYDSSQMLNAGNMYDNKAQQVRDSQVNRHNFNQNRGWDNLNRFNSSITGNYGSTGSTESPLYENNLAGILGGGLLGAGIGQQFGGNKGAAIGGGLGALGGWIFG